MSEETTDERETRNSVFSGQQQHSQLPQSRPPSELDIDLPAAGIPLPSLGKIYDKEPLKDCQELEIKAMTAQEEDILLNRNFIRNGTVISKLIKSCLLDKRIDVDEMLSGDRNALMIAIRALGYGTEYVPTISCPKCDTSQDFPISLDGLPIKELDLEKVKQVEMNTNQFSFTLPMTKKTVVFKFLTGKDEERILKDEEASKKKLGAAAKDAKISTRLANAILSINGIEDKTLISRFCQNMPARDSLALRHHIDNNEPSVDMSHQFTCQNSDCGHQEVIAIPLGIEFFWPKSRV